MSGGCLEGVWWVSSVWRVSMGCSNGVMGEGCLDVSERQVRTSQGRRGQVGKGQVRTGQARTGQVRTG